jgi:hypothetical protein
MKALLIGVVIALAVIVLSAQTIVRPEQLGTVPAQMMMRAFVFLPNGRAQLIELGSEFVISNGKLTIAIAPPAASRFKIVRTIVAQSADGSYPMVEGQVNRGGVAQTEGIDYDVIGGKVIPKMQWPWNVDDIVTVDTVAGKP